MGGHAARRQNRPLRSFGEQPDKAHGAMGIAAIAGRRRGWRKIKGIEAAQADLPMFRQPPVMDGAQAEFAGPADLRRPGTSSVLSMVSPRANRVQASSGLYSTSASPAFSLMPSLESCLLPKARVAATLPKSKLIEPGGAGGEALLVRRRARAVRGFSASRWKSAATSAASGLKDSRTAVESKRAASKLKRNWSGSRPVNCDTSSFQSSCTKPAVTTPKLTWVESSQ